VRVYEIGHRLGLLCIEFHRRLQLANGIGSLLACR